MKKLLFHLARKIFIGGIVFYQKFISPYKGFQCAHRVHTHGLSCSAYGKKTILEQSDFFYGLKLIRQRLCACAHVYEMYKIPCEIKKTRLPAHVLSNQGGFIDGCDGAGCSGCDSMSCEVMDCAPDFSACSEAITCSVCDMSSSSLANWEICLWFSTTTNSDCCDLPCYNSSSHTQHSTIKPEDNHIEDFLNQPVIPHFQLLDEMKDFLIYKHDSGKYYKIYKNVQNITEFDILNRSVPGVEELSEAEVKQLWSEKKSFD